MSTKGKAHQAFHKKTKESWLKLGFTDVMEWEEYIESYDGVTVMMGGIKGNH